MKKELSTQEILNQLDTNVETGDLATRIHKQ